MAKIEVQGVTYSYPVKEYSVKAIKNLSLKIEEGEFVTLAGMNGSGKSTLAKLLNGLYVPENDGGKILIDGLDTADEANCFEIRKKVGMIFQNPDNQAVATIIEDDVAFGPENIGLPRDEIVERVDKALELVGMTEFRHRDVSKLSGGQKQRVAIAGVLAMRPEVIIFDESTSMLDPLGRSEIMAVAKRLNEQGITIINISHDMEEAALSDRIIVLRKGRLALDGTPKQVFRSGQLEACGLALPNVTRLQRMLESEGFFFDGTVIDDSELVEGICRQLR